MKKRRLLSALLAASLLCTTTPAVAWAEDANTEPAAAEQASARSGALTIEGGTESVDYEWQNEALLIKGSSELTLSGDPTTYGQHIIVQAGVTANLKLRDVTIRDRSTLLIEQNATVNIECENSVLTLNAAKGTKVTLEFIGEVSIIYGVYSEGDIVLGGTGNGANIEECIEAKNVTINNGRYSFYGINGPAIESENLLILDGEFSGMADHSSLSQIARTTNCTIHGGIFSYHTGDGWEHNWNETPFIQADNYDIDGGIYSYPIYPVNTIGCADIAENMVFGCPVAEGSVLDFEETDDTLQVQYKVVDTDQVSNHYTVSGDADEYTYEGRKLVLKDGADVTVSSDGQVCDQIALEGDWEQPTTATLTLAGIDFHGPMPAIVVNEGCELTIELQDGSDNSCETEWISRAAIEVKDSATLTIRGNGALNVKASVGGTGIGGFGGTVNIEDGDLSVIGGGYYGTAIGGSYMVINISGGDIDAIADADRFSGTGIGGEDAQIHISGGNIVAEGGSGGAAIFAIGYPTSSITIDGGTIKAATYEAAPAIYGTNIEISGGSVYAEAPIGSTYDSDERILRITINGGTVSVKLPETSFGACIGGRDVGKITISNGTVVTTGGARGIGSSAGGGDTIFSTGNGNPVIITNSISDVSGRDNWNGVFIVDNMNGGIGKVYGTAVTPTNDFTIPSGKTLEVDANQSLIVADGITATNNGTVIRDKNGVVDVQGTWLGNPVIVKGEEEGSAVTGVSLDKSTLSLQPGKSATLTATVTPGTAANKSLRWTSSNTGVVTVDATGKVTAVANGTAVITVSTVDGGYTAQCTVTVSEDTPEVVAVENVKLDRSSLTLDVGETEQLTATVTPKNAANKSVRWRSNDENVVSVDANGKLTAIDSGIATVTVTTEEGNFTALCKVTVVDPDDTTTNTETKPDGSTVTTVEDVNGSSSTTTVDKNGVSATTVALSETSVEQAARNDAAVILPMVGVSATADMDTAPSVTVELPGSDTVKVEIPVLDLTPGTVAVLVDADGNETVIPNSVLGNNGLIVTLEDGDTVKILDNTQSYSDVATSHWAKDNIDYVTSRGLFVGVDDAHFAPETSMTRAMIVSVLQRYAGDTTAAAPGSDWYEGARQWAIAQGISDGTNMNGNVTREQLVTMFYRYIGSPQVVGSLNSYSDNASVSPYAEQAMVWAVRNGIIGGMTADTLAPQGLATRAQVAAILERFIAWEQNA